MSPRFEILQEKKFVGKSTEMSLVQNKIDWLWQSFMPLRPTVANVVESELYSIEVYPSEYFSHFNPHHQFEKWAAVEVSDFSEIAEGLNTLIMPGGLYAVFRYKGSAKEAAQFYQDIFSSWLPASRYQLDNRPHFAVMGEKYKNNDPESEEDILIPVSKR